MVKYYQVTDGEWIFQTMNKHKRACCDCGLVHVVDTRIAEKVKGGVKILPSSKLGLVVMYRATRDDKLSKERKRQMKRKNTKPGVEK